MNMKTKDGMIVNVGMWISNGNGIYEVTEVSRKEISAREVLFNEDDGANWEYDTIKLIFHDNEVSKMWYE